MPFSIAEVVSEMVNAGMPLSQIAGLDLVQIDHIVFRPRDKNGALKRDRGLPEGVLVDSDGMRVIGRAMSYDAAFRKAGGKEDTWAAFVANNPEWNTSNGRRRPPVRP
jgi:hypothetical protein